jgi:hypothetical protein
MSIAKTTQAVKREQRLTRIGEPFRVKVNANHRKWFAVYECNCGSRGVFRANNVDRGLSRSCGCSKGTHNQSYSPIYQAWKAIRQRCGSPAHRWFNDYGGRGITVCARWDNSFELFAKDMGERPSGMTLDRINNEGDYTPENCRWATMETQSNNTRANVYLTVDGVSQTISQWSRQSGTNRSTMNERRRQGWSDREIVYGRAS